VGAAGCCFLQDRMNRVVMPALVAGIHVFDAG
jgi:hypothetical protein